MQPTSSEPPLAGLKEKITRKPLIPPLNMKSNLSVPVLKQAGMCKLGVTSKQVLSVTHKSPASKRPCQLMPRVSQHTVESRGGRKMSATHQPTIPEARARERAAMVQVETIHQKSLKQRVPSHLVVSTGRKKSVAADKSNLLSAEMKEIQSVLRIRGGPTVTALKECSSTKPTVPSVEEGNQSKAAFIAALKTTSLCEHNHTLKSRMDGLMHKLPSARILSVLLYQNDSPSRANKLLFVSSLPTIPEEDPSDVFIELKETCPSEPTIPVPAQEEMSASKPTLTVLKPDVTTHRPGVPPFRVTAVTRKPVVEKLEMPGKLNSTVLGLKDACATDSKPTVPLLMKASANELPCPFRIETRPSMQTATERVEAPQGKYATKVLPAFRPTGNSPVPKLDMAGTSFVAVKETTKSKSAVPTSKVDRAQEPVIRAQRASNTGKPTDTILRVYSSSKSSFLPAPKIAHPRKTPSTLPTVRSFGRPLSPALRPKTARTSEQTCSALRARSPSKQKISTPTAASSNQPALSMLKAPNQSIPVVKDHSVSKEKLVKEAMKKPGTLSEEWESNTGKEPVSLYSRKNHKQPWEVDVTPSTVFNPNMHQYPKPWLCGKALDTALGRNPSSRISGIPTRKGREAQRADVNTTRDVGCDKTKILSDNKSSFDKQRSAQNIHLPSKSQD